MNNVLVIDALNGFYQLLHNREKDPLWSFIVEIKRIMTMWRINRVLLCADNGSSAYRLAIHPQYKSDRKKRREELPESEKIRLERFFKIYENMLKVAPYFGMEVLRFPNTEADDIAAVLTRNMDTSKHRMALLSSDRDWLQLLVDGSVTQRSYHKKMKLLEIEVAPDVMVNYKKFVEVYSITPTQYIDVKAIGGDMGDSVYSPPGISEKTALKLVQRYGSMEAIEENLDNLDIPRFGEKARQSLRDNFHMVHFNKKLVDLHHTPEVLNRIFDFQAQEKMNAVLGTLDQPPVLDERILKELLFEWGRAGCYNKFDEWIMPFKGADYI